VVRLDTSAPQFEINLLVNPPPANAPKAANARLELPITMARVGNFLVGINATPYTLPDKTPAQTESWKTFIPGVAVTLRGFAQPRNASMIGPGPAAPPYPVLWQNSKGKVGLTVKSALNDAIWALSAYHWLVEDGEVGSTLEQYSDLNYRSAAGVSANGRWFYLIVCGPPDNGDGQGVTLKEMASYLISLGVEDALSLDGGSSTSMIIRQRDGMLLHPPPKKMIARPSPVMLGVTATDH